MLGRRGGGIVNPLVSWDSSANTYTKSQVDYRYLSTLRRCNLSDNGTVLAYYGDTAFKEDGSNGQVMVEIPKFYYKTTFDGTTFTYRASGFQLDSGYKIHPAFVRGGVIKDKIYFSAYEGSIFDVSANTYLLEDEQVANFTVDTGDKLCSIANAKPCSGLTQNLTCANVRILARNRGIGWQQQDFLSVSAIQYLMLAKHGTFNDQSIYNGVTNISDDSSTNNAVKTGYTSTLGNLSGQVSVSHYRTGQITYPFSFHGIENFYGNLWKFVDGINIQNNIPYVAESNFADDVFTDAYSSLGITMPNINNWQENLAYTSNFDYGFLPSVVGTNSGKITDYYYQNTGNRVGLLGGRWSDGSGAGARCWAFDIAASRRHRAVGCRLFYIP